MIWHNQQIASNLLQDSSQAIKGMSSSVQVFPMSCQLLAPHTFGAHWLSV